MGSTKDLGLMLRATRRAQELSLRELARLAGVSHSYLAAFERGERDPSSRWVLAVNQALADHLRGDDAA